MQNLIEKKALQAPQLSGSHVLITGATSGLGFGIARSLCQMGAIIHLTGRNLEKGERALHLLRTAFPNAIIDFSVLDLASQNSITAFSQRYKSKPIDVLINNAGVMTLRKRVEAEKGYELQFATNHLGHFALTGLLLPNLIAAKGRIITISSLAAHKARIDFSDLNAVKRYRPMDQYALSKLANLLFSRELSRLITLHHLPIQACAVHPGWCQTEMLQNCLQIDGNEAFPQRIKDTVLHLAMAITFRLFGHDVPSAVRSVLMPLMSSAEINGRYYGPQGYKERKGFPGVACYPKLALSDDLARHLWRISEKMSGVHFLQKSMGL